MKNKQYCKVTINTANGPIDVTSHFDAGKFHYEKPDGLKPTYLSLHSLNLKNGNTIYFPDDWELIDAKSDGKSVIFSQTKHKNHL